MQGEPAGRTSAQREVHPGQNGNMLIDFAE
jgi:hypothetical protein